MKKILLFKNYINRFIKHPLFSGGMIMVGGNMFVSVINYAYHLIMGRTLGPVNYGILASIYSILYLISVVPSSASISIIKFVSSAKSDVETYSIYRSLSNFVFYLAIILSSIFIFISPSIAKFLHI